MPVYLDCNATTPVDPRVRAKVVEYLDVEFGNAGSRTHEYGLRAKRAVQQARRQVATVVDAKPEEVIFTSGATESNNLAILGLEAEGRRTGRRHVVSTQIEHKAVLEPLDELEQRGFSVTRIPGNPRGWIDPREVLEAIRDDTLLVSVLHVNNETGVIQPIRAIADVLAGHSAFFHVDAAQGFAKEFKELLSPRVDLISVSGHKIHGPKGVGALIAQRRGFKAPPLTPLHFGGGQERGLRPGTLAVHAIAGLGLAADLGRQEAAVRETRCRAFRTKALEGLDRLNPRIHGDVNRTVAHTLNVSFPGLDSEAVIVVVKDLVAISNGSACTSQSYEPSHVLAAMGLPKEQVEGAVRLSWSHDTPDVDWAQVTSRIASLR